VTYDDVCAVVVTRGDNNDVVRDIVRDLPYGEVIVWDNSQGRDLKVFGRYAAAWTSQRPVVFFQDDDVKLPQQAHDALLANYTPGILVSNMYDEWIESMGYFDLAMVGLGSIMDNGLWEEPFERWYAKYGRAWDDHILLDPDFIFGVLAKWRRFDFDAAASILPVASDESRLWQQPGQHERKYETISMARKLRTVVLTMLARNEEANIERALHSSAPWWDHLLLLDTGSTDSTIKIAQDYCDVNEKTYDVIEHEFTNFAEMRTLLLREGRELGDYMLLQDADEEWAEVPDRPELWAEAYMLHYEGGVDYAQPRLIASRFPWKWSGAIHSYLDSDWDGECLAVNMPTPLIVHHGDERHDTQRDIDILEAEIARTDDDLHRNLFLLGKAYDGMKEFDKAIECYQRRVDLNALDAEDYWCRLRLGNLAAEHLNDFARAVDTLWAAHKTRPQRNEALRALAFYCTAMADATPYPEDDITLVLRDSYR
jgi:tetratricopeptide (TPR) repeat protein